MLFFALQFLFRLYLPWQQQCFKNQGNCFQIVLQCQVPLMHMFTFHALRFQINFISNKPKLISQCSYVKNAMHCCNVNGKFKFGF